LQSFFVQIDEQKKNMSQASNYQLTHKIGSGSFGHVYRAKVLNQESGADVAIKIMDLDKYDTSIAEATKEIATMSLMRHPNIVSIHTSFVVGACIWIVMDLLDGGSCCQVMKRIAPRGFKDERLISTIVYETLKGLHYLHSTDNRVHRDVKSGNILIGADGRVQLSDFGTTTTTLLEPDAPQCKRKATTMTGTLCWMAPEVIEDGHGGYNEKADIWSLGITVLELGFGHAPYSKFLPAKVMKLTLAGAPPNTETYHDEDTSHTFSSEMHHFIELCLIKDPLKRPNAQKLLKHKFLLKHKHAQHQEYVREYTILKLPRESTSAATFTLSHDTSLSREREPISLSNFSFNNKNGGGDDDEGTSATINNSNSDHSQSSQAPVFHDSVD